MDNHNVASLNYYFSNKLLALYSLIKVKDSPLAVCFEVSESLQERGLTCNRDRIGTTDTPTGVRLLEEVYSIPYNMTT